MQKHKRIFIVDDDPFWASMLETVLSNLGYTSIYVFKNGTDCMNNIHLNPKLVFLDYQMDDKNGLEVLREIKNYYPGIGIVFCTGKEDLSLAVNAMKYGSFDYLLKTNASPKQIAQIIHEMSDKQVFADKIF